MKTCPNLYRIIFEPLKSKHKLLLGTLLLLILSSIFNSCKNKEKELFEKAKNQFENNELTSALANINEAISIEPRFTDAYALRGNIKSDLGDFSGAIIDYSKAIEIDSVYSFAYSQRGFVFYYLGKYKDAITDLSKALRFDPLDENTLAIRGDAYLATNDYDKAIYDYTQCISLKGSNQIKAYYSRGYTKAKKNDYKGALADYLIVYKSKPEDYNLLLDIGVLKNQINELDSAIYYYTKAIEIDSLHSNAYQLRGQVRDELSDYIGSISDYTMAIKYDSTNCNYYFLRSYSKTKLGLKEDGKNDLQKAIKLGYKFETTD